MSEFRTQLVTILGAQWGCESCKSQGMVFDPHMLKSLQEKKETSMECPNCKTALKLIIPSIVLPNEQLPLPGLPVGI